MKDLAAAVSSSGFAHRSGVSPLALVDVLETLGMPIHFEEVRDTPGAPSLVRSRAGIPWHTDHHRAQRIVWHCLASADNGGETLVVDGLAALDLISMEHRDRLAEVELFEHSVFRGDSPRHPVLVHAPDRRPKIYFSLWFVERGLPREHRDAVDAFADALGRVPHHRFQLAPGDILAIDNTRMLHARTPIVGATARHLRRYWLETT